MNYKIPHIRIVYTTPYMLAKPPSTTKLRIIVRNLQAFINKKNHNYRITIEKQNQIVSMCKKKWIITAQIHHKLSNYFRKSQQTTRALFTKFLKFRSTQYMGNTILLCIPPCSCLATKCTCLASLRPNIVCIQRACTIQTTWAHIPTLSLNHLKNRSYIHTVETQMLNFIFFRY